MLFERDSHTRFWAISDSGSPGALFSNHNLHPNCPILLSTPPSLTALIHLKLTMDIAIDASLKRQLDPLTKAELEHLRESLLSEGCREAIAVWATNFQLDCCGCSQTDVNRFRVNEHDAVVCTRCQQPVTRYDAVLIDGHNRYEICDQHNIPLKIKPMLFASRSEVEDWIDRNQVGKRNLSLEAFRIVTGRIYLRRKRKHGNEGGEQDRRLKHQVEVLANDVTKQLPVAIDTAAEVAQELGVSKATVQRNAQRAEVHDRMMLIGDTAAMQAAKSLPQKDIARARQIAKDSNGSLAAKLKSLSQQRFDRSEDRSSSDQHQDQRIDTDESRRPLAMREVDLFLTRLDVSPADVRKKVIRGLMDKTTTTRDPKETSKSVLATHLSTPTTPDARTAS